MAAKGLEQSLDLKTLT